MRTLLYTTMICALPFAGWGQAAIVKLANPSFEGYPGYSKLPEHWFNGGFDKETASDLQPGFFGCSKKPVHGRSYVGMVTRDNNTWERVGQKLSQPLLKDTLYRFNICLSTSGNYVSYSRRTGMETNYTAPVRLRIWGGNAEKNEEELLAESPVVAHRDWIRYDFEIKPIHFDINQVVLEAYFGNPNGATNGNLLLDNCSAFVPASVSIATPSVNSDDEVVSADVIKIFNPSFEEFAGTPGLPTGWETDDQLKSKYRVHPAGQSVALNTNPKTTFIVNDDAPLKRKAADQNRFTSLLASKAGLTQMISQQLEGVMKKDSAYSFSIHLAHNKYFKEEIAPTRYLNYKNPLKLRIWSSNSENLKHELLAESNLVVNDKWQEFNFILKPLKQDCKRLTFEACHVSESGESYDGNLLLDHCSDLVKISP